MDNLLLPPGDWTPLPVHASIRLYFRGEWEGRPALLAHFGTDQDSRERFATLALWLRQREICVPDLLEAVGSAPWVIQEFVEGESLARLRWDQTLEERVLETALSFARLELAKWPDGLLLHSLDEPRLRFELAFFDLHFLQGLLNWPKDEARAAALGSLAEEVAAFPPCLVHRDFHSDNLLLDKNGRLVVIDFQDLLLGPRCYDIASLLVDGYRAVSPGFRERCLHRCIQEWGSSEEELALTALQRGLKALGTFGYQVTRLKRPRYLAAARESLPKVVRLLKSSSLERALPSASLQEAAAWM